jgi:hypothetical protein
MTFEIPVEEQEKMLLLADDRAVQGVNAGLGGPFGAILSVYYPDGQGQFNRYVFATEHNRVRSTGFAGAHAEYMAMEVALRNGLREFLKVQPGSKVVLDTSGESCSNCRAKEEILARHLIAEGLIEPKDFIVYYGANFEDALKKAGFNDAPYVEDFQKPEESRAIPVIRASLSHPYVNKIRTVTYHGNLFDDDRFSACALYIPATNQVLAYKNNFYSYAGLKRSFETPFENIAMSTIRLAGKAAVRSCKETPWDMNKAALVLSCIPEAMVGPMMYATAQWANIGEIVLVHKQNIKWDHEAPGIKNVDLFKVVAAPYDQSDTVVTIHTDSVRPKLRAQDHWGNLLRSRKLPATALYNGLQIERR